MKIPIPEPWLAAVAIFLARCLFLTLRLRLDDRAGFTVNPPDHPVLITFWHNRILAITLCFLRRYHASRKGVVVLTSPSRDGRLLAAVTRGFGMDAVFGSNNKRPAQAVHSAADTLASGRDIAITPDGPRGPRYHLQPGVVFLSQKTGAPILPVHASFSRCFRLKSWDGFCVPLPFSTISVRIDPYERCPATSGDEPFEAERLRIEEILKNEAN